MAILWKYYVHRKDEAIRPCLTLAPERVDPVFSDVLLVDTCGRFRGTCCNHLWSCRFR